MMELNKELRQYCRDVCRSLPCNSKEKRKIMAEVRSNVLAYLTEKPNADRADIESRFGTPKQIAASYIDAMEPQEMLRELNIRRKAAGIIAAAIAAIILLWGIGVGIASADFISSTGGYFDVYINP